MPIHKCPAGCIEGYVYKPGVDRVYFCRHCQGSGTVDPDVMCSCGLPANRMKEGIKFCGTDACFKYIREEMSAPNRHPFSSDTHRFRGIH